MIQNFRRGWLRASVGERGSARPLPQEEIVLAGMFLNSYLAELDIYLEAETVDSS